MEESTMNNSVLVHYEKSTAVITLNRPEQLNCFNYDMLVKLGEILEEVRFRPDIRTVIFTGEGPKAFSTGADLKERRNLTEAQVRRNVAKIRDVFSQIEALPQPTIAAVNGHALGGGFELILACDLRIAVPYALLGLTEVSWGIIPGAGGTQRLPRLIGETKAKELIYTARRITASQAKELGLLNGLTTTDELLASAYDLAEEINRNAPMAVQQTKYAIQTGGQVDLQTGLSVESKAYEVIIPTHDRIEALEAFREKRTPEFQGK
jgi:enoyl-CoA hydratase